MSDGAVNHPIFARFFDGFSRLMEREAGPYRDELLSGLSGTVVEVGAGNGINFGHYPHTVERVLAIEPEPYLRQRAARAAEQAPVPVSVQAATAEALPVASGTCDAAVACLVLCTAADVPDALAEIRRVLKPGGELRFLEHVRADSPRKAAVQRSLDRSGAWPLVAGGCHCARNTLIAIEQAGFTVGAVREVGLGPSWAPTNPHVLGTARVP